MEIAARKWTEADIRELEWRLRRMSSRLFCISERMSHSKITDLEVQANPIVDQSIELLDSWVGHVEHLAAIRIVEDVPNHKA